MPPIVHRKTFVREEGIRDEGTGNAGASIVVEGPLSPEALQELAMHPELTAFRPPEAQHAALIAIAGLPEGRVIVARDGRTIVGYVTFHHPDPLERWAEARDPRILELGGIEVAPPYRRSGIAKRLLRVAFQAPEMEDYLVYSTEYYWHWDLRGTGLDVWDYGRLMERLMGTVGLERMATDDPDIAAHPANALMVRIGRNVPWETVVAFDRLRFRRPMF
ncbi:GNAT family N-acetyltransferase [Hydrogenibacillus sp. N12]|uniref:GNAT family N-acetyltransferase n=1 Tax=Hydrogenibacillus sp. N12 TaxID=2866627 RepID=UPI001C7D9849|nr:GNAT family N-acetyltransferase [Hydrogenibacillus sp. N12]QZA33626.1 GNAT family N-acetyltransferase [Hydrogenibacillus sp. N12]